jgi:hypothetical protein
MPVVSFQIAPVASSDVRCFTESGHLLVQQIYEELSSLLLDQVFGL